MGATCRPGSIPAVCLLSDSGQTIPWNDILVAAVSVSRGWRIYARDRHFDAMRDVLGLRLYEPDYGGKYRPEAG